MSRKLNIYTCFRNLYRFSVFLIISGCAYNVDGKHFTAEIDEGFLRSFVVTCPKVNGVELTDQCKITLCNGWAGLASDVMKNAAVVGGAALIGAGISNSGDSSSTTNINRLTGGNSSATATSSANAASSAVSGANAVNQVASQPHPVKRHYGAD